MTNGKNIFQEANGLLASIGFRVKKASEDDYEIVNRCGRTIVHGKLETMYYCAFIMANEAKENPGKYEQLNEAQDANELYQAGLAMAKKLQK